MFSLLYNKTPHFMSSILRNFCDLRVLERTPVIIIRYLSSTISSEKQLKEPSFTVSYLINSCGLSPKDANVVSKKLQFETPDRPDSVLASFNKHGFNDSQIARIVKIRPKLLLADPDKTIASKLEFFYSIGITRTNVAELISSNPRVLTTSLSNRIIPLYKLLKSTLLFDDHNIIRAMTKASRFFVPKEASIKAIIAYFREVGMPESRIQQLAIHYFHLLCFKVDISRKKIDEVIDMGFRPAETKFIQALAAVSCMSASTWQHKIAVFVNYGWSKDEIKSAFKKNPRCMSLSEKKIINSMVFFVNVLDLKPSAIAEIPDILAYSLEKRTIPRGLVVKILMLKGLFEKNASFFYVLQQSEKLFLQRYVEKHKEHVPYLMDVYEGRMCPQELRFLSKYIQKHVDI